MQRFLRPFSSCALSLGLACGVGLMSCARPQTARREPLATTSCGPFLAAIPAEVRSAERTPTKTAPHGKASVTLLAEGHNAFLGKLVLAPHAQVPEHQDTTEEYIHVLSGRGEMTMDGKSFPIEPGTTVYMPAFAKVSVQNGPEPLVAIQVFAGPEPARKYDGWQ